MGPTPWGVGPLQEWERDALGKGYVSDPTSISSRARSSDSI